MTRDKARAEWVRRLRSGDYKQGRRRLYRDGAHCVMGVLAEVLIDACKLTRSEDCPGAYEEDGIPYRAYLPPKACEWVGLYSAAGSNYMPGSPAIVVFNDQGVPFSVLADMLESGEYWSLDGNPQRDVIPVSEGFRGRR